MAEVFRRADDHKVGVRLRRDLGELGQRTLTPPPQYALLWRATLSAAGLFAQLGATVPTRGFHLAYSPGFRGSMPLARPRRTGEALRHAS